MRLKKAEILQQKADRVQRIEDCLGLQVTAFLAWCLMCATAGKYTASIPGHGYTTTSVVITMTLLGAVVGIGVLTPIMRRLLWKRSVLQSEIKQLT